MGIAVVTGATKGIGKSITYKLLKRGIEVVGCYSVDKNSANVCLEEAERRGGKLNLLQVNLGSYDEIQFLISEIKKKNESVKYLIINAGITDRTPFKEIKKDMWENVISVNLSSTFYLVQGLDQILENGAHIIFIGTVMGEFPHAMSLSYAVSKAALHQLAKNLVKEFASRKITVNVVAPGFVNTTWQANKDIEHRRRIENRIALGRFAEASEIAEFCMSVLDSSYINGAILNIDGGYDFF